MDFEFSGSILASNVIVGEISEEVHTNDNRVYPLRVGHLVINGLGSVAKITVNGNEISTWSQNFATLQVEVRDLALDLIENFEIIILEY